MSGWTKAGLALAALLLGGWLLAWQGVIFAMAGIVAWLVWEMVQLARLMKLAGAAPLGSVADAEALHARLREGLRLEELLRLTGSLGQKLPGPVKAYAWQDAQGRRVEVQLVKGRVSVWRWMPVTEMGPAS
jgi:hypothetical protein